MCDWRIIVATNTVVVTRVLVFSFVIIVIFVGIVGIISISIVVVRQPKCHQHHYSAECLGSSGVRGGGAA